MLIDSDYCCFLSELVCCFFWNKNYTYCSRLNWKLIYTKSREWKKRLNFKEKISSFYVGIASHFAKLPLPRWFTHGWIGYWVLHPNTKRKKFKKLFKNKKIIIEMWTLLLTLLSFPAFGSLFLCTLSFHHWLLLYFTSYQNLSYGTQDFSNFYIFCTCQLDVPIHQKIKCTSFLSRKLALS